MLPAIVQASWLDGIGGVEEAFGGDLLADGQIGDAGLHARCPVREVRLEHAVHLGDAEDDGVLLRDGAAAQRGAGPARHDLDAVGVAELQHRRDLLGRRGQHDGQRHLAVGGEGVGLEGAALVLRRHQSLGRDKLGETGQKLVATSDHALIGLGECDGHGCSSMPPCRGGCYSLTYARVRRFSGLATALLSHGPV